MAQDFVMRNRLPSRNHSAMLWRLRAAVNSRKSCSTAALGCGEVKSESSVLLPTSTTASDFTFRSGGGRTWAKLSGKVAVVTGASKGIGAAIAKAYGAEGAAVVVNYHSDKAGAERVVESIRQAGGKAIAVAGNVSRKADVEKLFAEAKKAFGQL